MKKKHTMYKMRKDDICWSGKNITRKKFRKLYK